MAFHVEAEIGVNSMAGFASSVRFKVKAGMNEEFERLTSKTYEGDAPRLKGRLYGRLVKTGAHTYCSFGEWESEEDLINARPAMIELLDGIRHTLLEEISPELGVTDPVSGPVVVSFGAV